MSFRMYGDILSEKGQVELKLVISINNNDSVLNRARITCLDCADLNDHTGRHQGMEIFSVLLTLCEGYAMVTKGFPYKGSVTWGFYLSFMCAWTRDWTNHGVAGDLTRYSAYVTSMYWLDWKLTTAQRVHAGPSSHGSWRQTMVISNILHAEIISDTIKPEHTYQI